MQLKPADSATGKLRMIVDKHHVIGFICTSTSWGGLEMNVLRLAGWLAERRWPVIIYGTAETPLARHAINRQFAFRALPKSGKYGGLFSGRNLGRMLTRDDVAVLTIHTSSDILVSSLGARFAKNRPGLVFMQHMQLGSDKRDLLHTLQYRSLDAWVTPLHILADGVRSRTRIDPGKIHVIPYGIDLAPFTENLPSKENARRSLKLPLDATIAGVVGRFDPKKGQDILVRAGKIVHERGHALHLLFVGEETRNEQNGYFQSVRKLATDTGLAEFVHFSPFIDDIQRAYAAINIFVLTSHSETYGMVTIEAMAAGLPVIVTNTGGSTGIVSNNVNGLLVPPQDPNALADALCSLLDSPTTTASLAGQAKDHAITTYSHNRECELIERLFASLIAAG